MSELILSVGQQAGDIIGKDNRAIQAAVDQVAALGGGTVVVGAGTWLMEDSLHLRSKVRVVGEGDRTVLRKAASVRSALSDYLGYGHYDVSVAEPEKFKPGMGIVVNDKHSPGFYQTVATITWKDGNLLGISKMLVHDYNWQNGGAVTSVFPVISVSKVRNAVIENLVIDGNWPENEHLNGCRGGGIFLIEADDVAIRGVTVRNYHGEGISFQQCRRVLIEDTSCLDNAGMGLHPGSGSVAPVMRRCTLRNNGAGGVFYCLRVSFSLLEDCTIVDNGGIGISIGARDTDQLIRNNVIRNNGYPGLSFRSDASPIHGNRVQFEGNTLEGNARSKGDGEIVFDAAVRDVHLLRNKITCSKRGSESLLGIKVCAEARDLVLHDNTIDGAFSKPIEALCPEEAIRFDKPLKPLAVGPQNAPKDADRHLG